MTRSALAVAAALLGVAAPASARPYDFDGDRRQDVALGVPGWSEGGAPNAGLVIVLRPARNSLSTRPELFTEGVDGLPGVAQGDDALGASVASGDFDGDGFADLAIAAPGDGATLVIPGSRTGLRKRDARMIAGTGPLVAGDVDGDGDADLLVGRPGAKPLSRHDYASGAIRLHAGGPRGLRTKRFRVLARPNREDAFFGSALAVGDVNGDGHLDIVEGSQGYEHNSDGEGYPGHLSFCPGTRSGPKRCLTVGAPLPGGPTTLAVADIDGDGFDDVLAGRPINRYVVENTPSGAVRVWPGTPAGPGTVGPALSQNTPGVPGRAESGDEFGRAVAAADIDGDRYADVLIGAPGEDGDRGTVVYIRGGPHGVTGARGRRLEQARSKRRAGDRFGAALTLVGLTGGHGRHLVAGAPGERSITLFRAGRSERLRAMQRIVPSRLGLRIPPEPPDVLSGFGGLLARPAGS